MSAVSKSKGKEKATNLPPPFTFAPRAAASSASLADVHNTGVAQEVDEEMGEPGEEDEEEDVEEEVEEEGDDEGPVDMMAVEDEEQRRDVAGLEEPGDLPAEA